MEQSTSSKVDIPPWESADTPQVSYTDSASVGLSPTEREALLALWAAQLSTIAPSIDEFDVAIVNRTVSRRARLSSSNNQSEVRMRTPLTPPGFQSKAVDIPAGPKTELELPSFVMASNSNRHAHIPSASNARQLPPKSVNAPPTPPYSNAGSWDLPCSYGSPKRPCTCLPPSPHQAVSNWDAGVDSAPASRHKCTCQDRKRPSRIARWKSAVKEFFHHDPGDDSELEHIDIVHWTDQ
jgi:hypothetical protein